MENFSDSFRFFPIFTSKLQANYEQIKYNYLIYNKIKFLFFLLKALNYLFLLYICIIKQQHKTTTKTKRQ